MTPFSFQYMPSCEPRLSSGGYLFLASYRQSVLVISTLERYLRCVGKGGVGWYVCYVLPARFTTERQPVLRPEVEFSKISFKHR
jgi:hypothetical protein